MKNPETHPFISLFQEFGLSEKEARIYFAMLGLGPSTVLNISKAAEVKRPTAYLVVGSLNKKGLVAIQTSGFKKLFAAENPKKLEYVIESRKTLLDKNMEALLSLYNAKSGDSIIISYSGLSAVKGVYEELLSSLHVSEEYFVISDTEQWLAMDRQYFLRYSERRAKMELDLRLLLIPSQETLRFKPFEKNFGGQVRLLPKERLFSSHITIASGRAIFVQMEPPYETVVIKNASIVKTLRETFLALWEALEKG